MSTIRSLLARKFLAPLKRRTPSPIQRVWNVERLEDRLNPAPIPLIGGLPGAGTLTPLLGEATSIGFTYTYTNTGDQTGFSPFLDVIVDTTGADGAGVQIDDGIVAAPTISGRLTTTPSQARRTSRCRRASASATRSTSSASPSEVSRRRKRRV